jgi:pimeloyl-ACP methyl ester carboxylesterase
LNASYATLSFDRQGFGNSSHGEPLNEIQATVEVAVTVQSTEMLRSGTFPSVSHAFQKVVHVGHSFGSGQTYVLANMYPKLSDAIVLTGFSLNNSFTADFLAGGAFVKANKYSPKRFGNASETPLPNGYLISGLPSADAFNFFLGGYFDPDLFYTAEKKPNKW